MKQKLLYAALAVLLLLSVVVVYAHGDDNVGVDVFEEMDEMHEWMTHGLDSETKEELDEIHNGCMGSFDETKETGTGIFRRMGMM